MSNRKPMVLFFAGPNGSGKSTITQYFEIVGEYTNADDMVIKWIFLVSELLEKINMTIPEVEHIITSLNEK